GGGIMHGSRLLTGSGYLLRVPAIDLAEVGAGGGSIVWRDAGGALQVGPRSAGAAPGPLCYDLGGTEPTVTDANVVLGYLNPAALAGGAVKLNATRAHDVFQERVAEPLGLPLAEAAYGAHLIAASNMMRAIRAVSSERGRDPREYALFAFGGNGPVFAAGMARQLEMRRIVVPPAPGLFSSFGLLFADVEHHYVRTWRRRARSVEPSALADVLARMEAEARTQLAAEGFTGAGGSRRVYFGPDLGWRETPIIDRGDLPVGGPDMAPHGIIGPCIVEEYDATCVVPPGARATLDGHGNIVIELAPEGAVI